MGSNKVGRPRKTDGARRRVELGLTVEVLEVLDQLRGPVERNAWVASLVLALRDKDLKRLRALAGLPSE